MSGGKYEKNVGNKILKINNKNNIRTHNYFLYPKKNFVINLASENKLIVKKSINLKKKYFICKKKLILNMLVFMPVLDLIFSQINLVNP